MLFDVINADDIIYLSIIIFVSFVGSFAKDYLKMFNLQCKMSFIKIILSTFTASILIFAFSPEIVNKYGLRGLTVASFFGGLIGFETLQRISTIDGAIELVGKMINLMSNIVGLLGGKKSVIKEQDDG